MAELVATAPVEHSRRSVTAAVLRRCGPHVLEATVVPTTLFYAGLLTGGLVAAYVGAAGWTYAALGRRLARRRGVPPILVLGVIGITIRTIVAILSHSSFVYFFQPVLGTVAMAGVFLASVVAGRPLIGRLAGEFWPITVEEAARPAVCHLFRRLTLLWAAVHLASATLTLSLLLSLPVWLFLAVKQVAGLALMVVAVFVTITMSLRTARCEGMALRPT
ncbi:MAG: putative rane protein [Actinomycetia bacterium]|nr:putative rane protein [Actinomycetes bacterium]